MAELRDIRIADFKNYLNEKTNKKGELIHLNFENLKTSHPDVYHVVKDIPTSFNIEPNEVICLKSAARFLVEDAMDNLLQDDAWKDLVNIPLNSGYEIKKCKPREKNK
jgi:hypothetical protein